MEPKLSYSNVHFKLVYMLPGPGVRVKWLAGELGGMGVFEFDVVDQAFFTIYNMQVKSQKLRNLLLLVQDTSDKTKISMFDSAAICNWLVEIFPNHNLKPTKNILGLAQYHCFITLAISSIDPLLLEIERNSPYAGGVPQNLVSKFRELVSDLEKALGSGNYQFLCEEYHPGFTVADVIVGYSLYKASSLGLTLSPTLQNYLDALKSRPAFKDAISKSTNSKSKPGAGM